MTNHEAQGTKHSLSRYWLLIGVTALAVAGLFSLVLVMARTPSLSSIPLFDAMFHKSLAVHVDLSVLVWFLAIACMMWSLLAEGSRTVFPLLEEAALVSFGLGTFCIAISPLGGNNQALMSNYIPVITSPLFFLGLALLFCGVGLMLVKALTAKWSERFSPSLRYGIFVGALIAVIALLAFVWSYRQLAHDFEPQLYYEMLFWGGGHLLQFLHVQMVMVCWLLLSASAAPRKDKLYYVLFTLGLLAALAAPYVYIMYNVASDEHRVFFTHSMIMVAGIAPTVLALVLAPSIWRTRAKNALWACFAMSVLLFLYGGVLGGMIEGQNVVIPAHYHGSIVGVTLAFMGVAYLLLPEFGYRDVSKWKMAFWQPIVYGGGQALHISGLAWSGGYGVLRKTPGGLDALPTSVKAAMGLMGLGGTIAIIGGFMFVIVVWRAIRHPRKA